MFKKEIREYKGDTIYIKKPKDISVELLLNIIVANIEKYVAQKEKMPKKIRLDYHNYNRILEHNKTLIEKRDGKYYTFGVQIEV